MACFGAQRPDSPNNYSSTGIITGYSYNGIGKVDENFTDKDHLAFTYFIGQGIQTAPLNSKLPPISRGPELIFRTIRWSIIASFRPR